MELMVSSPVPEHTQCLHLSMQVVEEITEEASFMVERREELVSPKGGEPTLRIGRFLKPCVDNVNEAAGIPLVPLLSEIITFTPCKWPPQVLFKGWRCPQAKWKQWVDRLVPLFGNIWMKADIYNAIMASTYRVRKDQDLVLALVEKWCPETSSFVFPWGEATITLEDIFILGGFSFVGKPITEPLQKEQEKMEKKMVAEHDGFYRHQWWNPSNAEWIKHFMSTQIELEHVAFLSLWLLRYVFPTPSERVMGKQVFHIAIHLAQGTAIALGPAVLAGLYRDLRFLKEQSVQKLLGSNKVCHDDDFHLSVWAPFQLMQLWAWERFPSLRPKKPNFLRPGEPRAALWSKLSTNMSIELVRLVMSSPENFQWRPYVANFSNWSLPPFYREREEWVSQSSNGNDELQSFIHCLWVSELIGLDSTELYLPYRVSMQFGLDQDIPGHFGLPRGSCREPIKPSVFYVPPRLFESDVTMRYSEWWKQSMLGRREAIKQALTQVQMIDYPRKIPRISMKEKARGNHVRALTWVSSEDHKLGFQGSTDENETQRLKNLQLVIVKEEDPYGPVPPGFSAQPTRLLLEDSSHKDELSVPKKFKLLKEIDEVGRKDHLMEKEPGESMENPLNLDTHYPTDKILGINKQLKVGDTERKAIEERIWELEKEISGLKAKLGFKEADEPTNQTSSHAS
ncbi:hypothetical protein NE237_001934 [Protea cynaroides]|uniref:Aminotransferase-like plant mobile domain-containing protein n=1 Tax=Protea cynaroides TaxID=273540 RepID=A0A9Q0QYK8_9MAGN|nr:hypothetical protein NE237_001934 [Protea cynaroides]